MSSSNAPIGPRLRQMRAARGLSLATLARMAEVPKSTLSAWENGRHAPPGPDLARALERLGADPSVRASLLAEADPRYAKIELAQARLGPPLGTGEIFRAMRVRVRLTQSAIAATLGVSQPTVARWETADALPSPELRPRLWALLNLSATEAAILEGRPEPVESSPEIVSRLAAAIDLPTVSLCHAALLVLEHDLWRRAAKDAAQEGNLALTMGHRCRTLPEAEARSLGHRALRLAGREHPEAMGIALVSLLVNARSSRRPPDLSSLIEDWHRTTHDPGLRAQVRCEQAIVLAPFEAARARDLAQSAGEIGFGAPLPLSSLSQGVGSAMALWPRAIVQIRQKDWEGALETFEAMMATGDPDTPLNSSGSAVYLAQTYRNLRILPPAPTLTRLVRDLEAIERTPDVVRELVWIADRGG